MAAPRTPACPACAALRARAEQAEAQLAEAQAQLAALQTHRAARKRRKVPDAPSSDWLLVEEIRDLLHVSVGDLATRLGLAYSTPGPRGPKSAEEHLVDIALPGRLVHLRVASSCDI